MTLEIEIPDEDVFRMLVRVFKVSKSEFKTILKTPEFRKILADDLLFCWTWMNDEEDGADEAIQERYTDVLKKLGVKVKSF